jgi:hypothetical protein
MMNDDNYYRVRCIVSRTNPPITQSIVQTTANAEVTAAPQPNQAKMKGTRCISFLSRLFFVSFFVAMTKKENTMMKKSEQR